MVATDGSENATRAVKVAIQLANKFRARLIVLHVVTITATAVAGFAPLYDVQLSEGEKIVNQAVKSAKTEGVKAVPVIPGSLRQLFELSK